MHGLTVQQYIDGDWLDVSRPPAYVVDLLDRHPDCAWIEVAVRVRPDQPEHLIGVPVHTIRYRHKPLTLGDRVVNVLHALLVAGILWIVLLSIW